MGIQSHIKASPNNTTVSMPCQAQISIDAKRIGLAQPADSFMKFSYIRYETKNYFKVKQNGGTKKSQQSEKKENVL